MIHVSLCPGRLKVAGLTTSNVVPRIVTSEEAKKILLALEPTPKEEDVDKFLENYEGTFCKKHMTQDFMMPNGYWLGKVNEKRPEEPMLPTGSVKKGYSEEYKAHHWMYDENGEKVEKKTRRSSSKKEKVEEKVEAVGGKVEDPLSVRAAPAPAYQRR